MSQSAEVARLVALIDRLEALLERAGLSELEVETAGTSVILRTPAALAPLAAAVTVDGSPSEPAQTPEEPARPRGSHAIVAPLTGVFYRSPSPGAEPYLREGGPVNAGQVIGLIEAMKLFNEIKSDVTGTVRHLAVGDGDLVKARQTLIEVDPA
ncbi:MAG TPA: acetyl-CoA carboxylase [Candidatus Deferrimicrobium sp.]|nr:acetyl-CoA carboxylase [Candidatus Deferrimicrobium sp.]